MLSGRGAAGDRGAPDDAVEADDFDDDAIEGDKTGFINHVITTGIGIEGEPDSHIELVPVIVTVPSTDMLGNVESLERLVMMGATLVTEIADSA